MTPSLSKFGPRLWVLVAVAALAGLEWGLGHFGGFGRDVPVWGDERLGWVKAPGRVGTDETGIEFRTNELGYRDRDWAPPAAPELSVLEGGRRGLRIAVLGDSMHYGPSIAEESLWLRKLERDLRAELGPDVIVMNFAVVGYVLEQCARVWEDQVRAWHPDVVLLGVNSASARPMRYLHKPRHGVLGDFVVESSTYEALQSLAREERAPWGVSYEAAPEGETRPAPAIEVSLRRTPTAPENERVWRAMLERLRGVARDVEASGGELVLLCIPRLVHASGDLERWTGNEWRAIAAAAGVAYLDLLGEFQSEMRPLFNEARARGGIDAFWSPNAKSRPEELGRAAESYYLFKDPEHLSQRGHARVEKKVLGHLREAGLLRP